MNSLLAINCTPEPDFTPDLFRPCKIQPRIDRGVSQPSWEVEDQAAGLRYRLPKLPQPWGPWQLSGVFETYSKVEELLLSPAKHLWPACDEPPEPTPLAELEHPHLRPWLESGNFRNFLPPGFSCFRASSLPSSIAPASSR